MAKETKGEWNIYSTLTAGQEINLYKRHESRNEVRYDVQHTVVIRGGANVTTKGLRTPLGVRTENLTDEDIAFLKNDMWVQNWIKDGFIRIEKKKMDPDNAAKNMESKDGSAPLKKEDFKDTQVDGKQLKVVANTQQ